MKKIYSLILSCFTIPILAQTASEECIEFTPSPYIKFESAASFSYKANISVKIPVWDPSPNGYNNNLDISPMYGIGFGYQFVKAFRSDFSIEYRPTYSYTKFQRSSTELSNKVRKFRLSNLSFLLNGYLCFDGFGGAWKTKYVTIAPFIGAGVGVSYNTVRNFHSLSKVVQYGVFSMMTDRLRTSVAAQGTAGLDFKWPHWVIGVGYRLFYGGKFISSDYLVDNPPPSAPGADGVTTVPWKGRLMANEVFLNLRYVF